MINLAELSKEQKNGDSLLHKKSERLPPQANMSAMTVDLEDYFQVSAFESFSQREQWQQFECRVEANTEKLLTLFSQHGIRATFFVLGWIAERYPKLIRTIAQAGHEIASHGYDHQRVHNLSRKAFGSDIRRSKALLEEISGMPVLGYRAPSFSISERTPWAYDELALAGYRYSSSVYPVKHDHYGSPLLPRFAFLAHPDILEVPISTLQLMGKNFPIGGGGYFRLYPESVMQWALRRFHRQAQQPYIFYIHPWELDPDQPRPFQLSRKTQFRHYLNLHKTEQRIAHLLSKYPWRRMDELFLNKSEQTSEQTQQAYNYTQTSWSCR
ncbi:XrtA system polysaccharide deacetylase [Motilimonas sp. KMU-193]|uniref:XrtA system polysaccharide deacetylase n=1 Tax=Motilimonas sp. KMU-193 TaxID=3388668 RepID=UPI00396B35F2